MTHDAARRGRRRRDSGRAAILGWVVLAVLWTMATETGWAASDVPDAREIVRQGTVEAGVTGGFWQAFDPWGDAISTDRSALFAMPRLGRVISPTLDASILSGNVEVLLEPFYAYFVRPFNADAYGGTLMLKYNFVGFGRWMPFWELGVGGVWTNLAPRIPEQSTRWNFVGFAGAGLQYFVTRGTSLTLGVRWHHISNASLGDRNAGFNAIMPYAGLSFFFPR